MLLILGRSCLIVVCAQVTHGTPVYAHMAESCGLEATDLSRELAERLDQLPLHTSSTYRVCSAKVGVYAARVLDLKRQILRRNLI